MFFGTEPWLSNHQTTNKNLLRQGCYEIENNRGMLQGGAPNNLM
jgi:hypothetical protein